MENLTRRQLLHAGAAGTVAAGIATLAGPAAAAAGSTMGGVHIHATLKQTGGPTLPVNGRVIDVTVYGPDDNLSGSGWDANPKAAGSYDLASPDGSQCFFTQHGSVQGDAVHLTGRNLFAMFPPEVGASITVDANLATGQIKWVDGEGSNAFKFEGTGVVTRI
jgi:hypothetical protein